MFGYVNAHKDLLRVCDYNIFRGYYCGLCKALGRTFNQLTRFGLSYDMTFLAVLLSSLEEDEITLTHEPCIAHPISRRPVIRKDNGIQYSADMSVLLTYYKLKDDWEDEKRLTAWSRAVYFFPMKKVCKQYPKQVCAIRENLSALQKLERENSQSPDETADCFGKLLAAIFDKDAANPVLAQLGYHIGRLIYLTDAFSDLDRDREKHCYNPFLARYGNDITKQELREVFLQSITFTLSEIATTYELLKIRKNKELLDNIIYLGLRKNTESV